MRKEPLYDMVRDGLRQVTYFIVRRPVKNLS
jgi:hypothetical protein